MTWLAPGFLLAGGAVAIAVIALHLIMHRLPPPAPLPTARFVPPGAARAARRAARPNDLLVLALRLAVVLLAAAALARPVPVPARQAVARIVVLDRSRAVASIEEVRATARALLEPGDLLVVLDSGARLASPDSLGAIERVEVRGSLSAGLVAAMHAAPALHATADSVEMVVVSPLATETIDEATLAIREEWRGRIRLVRVDAERAAALAPGLSAAVGGAPGDDPVAAAVALWRSPAEPRARIVRQAPAPDDSAWARAGGILVHWPAGYDGPVADSIGAIVARGAVVAAPFARYVVDAGEAGGVPVAWWADGQPAALQRPLGAGCVRDVAVDVPARGDLVLRPAFRRLLLALTEPCDGVRALEPAPAAVLASLAGTGGLVPASTPGAPARTSAIMPWLLGAALMLALAEPLLRRRPLATDEVVVDTRVVSE